MKSLTKADFGSKLKSFLKNNHALRPQGSELSKNAKSAAFELGPRPDFAHNLYVECRWEPWSKSPALAPLEKDVVRVVLQFKNEFAHLTEPVASTLMAAAGKRFDVRVSNSEGTIYIAKVGLPRLDVTILPSQQRETSLKYGEECNALAAFWKDNVSRVNDAAHLSTSSTMPTKPKSF